MVSNKRKPPGSAAADHGERSKRFHRSRHEIIVPARDLAAKRALPVPKIKHRSYYEFVENKEKKKKLEFEFTYNKTAPPGFRFVPAGNPKLTTECKELSRELGLKIFIVSDSQNPAFNSYTLANQMNRVGHHFDAAVVQEAELRVCGLSQPDPSAPNGAPEPIPESQILYHSQVDSVLRDLFPRIPHTDRRAIIQHAFTRGTFYRGGNPVGLSDQLTLTRRIQLAVLAHIRHTHTRYEELLRTVEWSEARKAVQSLCLDVLVKWRGDEETGRDQLDEILREVVVISDSEDDEGEADSTDDTSGRPVTTNSHSSHRPSEHGNRGLRSTAPAEIENPLTPSRSSTAAAEAGHHGHGTDRRGRRGFERYHRAWQEAIRRNNDAGSAGRDAAGPVNCPPESAFHRAPGPQPPVDALGNAPSTNGYVPQGLPAYRQLPGPRSGPQFRGVRDEVNVAVRGQPPLDASGPHIQDMLVRSVEPAQPELGQSSLASAPPNPWRSPARQSTQYRPSRTPSPSNRGDCGLSGRQAMSDRWPHGCVSPGSFPAEGLAPMSRCRDLNVYDPRHGRIDMRDLGHGRIDVHDPGHGGHMATVFPMSPSLGRVHEAAVSLNQPTADRIVVNASRPGTRHNQVLMEDRGGFYERIEVQSDPPPQPGFCESAEARWLDRQVPRAPKRQIVASQEQDAMAPQESRARIAVETAPLRSPGMIASPARRGIAPVASQAFSAACDLGQRLEFDRHQPPGGGYDVRSRPVSGEYYSEPLTQPHQEQLRFDAQPSFPGPDYRQYRNHPVMIDHYASYRREHPPRIYYADHVDVFQ